LLTVKIDGYNQNLLVTTTKSGKFFYGDRVWLTGKVAEAKAFEDFDYKGYLERHNVYGLMRYPKAIVLKIDQGNKLVYGLLKLKHWFVARLSEVLSSPYDSLLLGILIGAKRALPEELYQQFINTGTSHIIAISGFNISVIVGALAFLPYYLGRRVSFFLTLLVIGIFVVMSGASASVVRAALMGGLLLTSFGIGRLYSITPALCCAALLMLLVNPRILFWDVGFQLSFLATAGIVYGVEPLEILTKKWPSFFGLKTIFFTTLTAVIATLPLTLFEFGRLSLVALLVNMLVLPIVPAAMFFGFFSALPLC
jgi:competence protein ComEC